MSDARLENRRCLPASLISRESGLRLEMDALRFLIEVQDWWRLLDMSLPRKSRSLHSDTLSRADAMLQDPDNHQRHGDILLW